MLFCYDLPLPPTFVPKPVDGEVEDFKLFHLEEVEERFRVREGGEKRGWGGEFKVSDFAIFNYFW